MYAPDSNTQTLEDYINGICGDGAKAMTDAEFAALVEAHRAGINPRTLDLEPTDWGAMREEYAATYGQTYDMRDPAAARRMSTVENAYRARAARAANERLYAAISQQMGLRAKAAKVAAAQEEYEKAPDYAARLERVRALKAKQDLIDEIESLPDGALKDLLRTENADAYGLDVTGND